MRLQARVFQVPTNLRINSFGFPGGAGRSISSACTTCNNLLAGVANTEHDFTLSNKLMPHPIYARRYWGQMLSPSKERFVEILPLIEEAYLDATVKFEKKVKRPA
jgi:hypothetical protein